MARVSNKVALVTGGAKGIGEACALLLAKEGAKVVVSDLDIAAGEKVVKAIKAAGGEAIFIQQDVTDEASWPKAIAAAVERFGALHVLVNNAGIAIPGSAVEATLADWRKTMAVNLDAVFLGTKYAIPAMTDKNGSIINISSIEGIVADPNLAAYNASKGGVRIFTKSAALHCGKNGLKVRVNSVHPGYIWTPMVEDYVKSIGDVAEGRAALDSLHPIGHVGDVMDVAYGVLYLASDESKFVTGSELVIDGGYTAQ
ncbi:glucose 1-dehydrogenase [Nevskia ramosa]|uniref:glucose 1-dehydrogenase n=1 Tax=Nevskia ramosa TaxID=64002 RepID=UPI002354A847|nr:glucose 1-dehydrogenase [Nevskia ramosa]